MNPNDSDAMLTRATGGIQDTREAQPSAPLLFNEWDGDTDADRQDGTAGCEFVDDRIRLE